MENSNLNFLKDVDLESVDAINAKSLMKRTEEYEEQLVVIKGKVHVNEDANTSENEFIKFIPSEKEMQELKVFLSEMGFTETPIDFYNKNIVIYFRVDKNEWRIKNINHTHGMDLTGFNLPLNEENKKLIWKTVSDNYTEK